MDISIALYLGIVLHLVGDYVTQNDYVANNKTSRSDVAFIHVLLYSLPFIAIVPSMCWFIVSVSHFFIDRFRLAVYWIRFMNWNWRSENFGFDNEKPKYLSIWLMIIIDNVFHLIFNTIAIFAHYS